MLLLYQINYCSFDHSRQVSPLGVIVGVLTGSRGWITIEKLELLQ